MTTKVRKGHYKHNATGYTITNEYGHWVVRDERRQIRWMSFCKMMCVEWCNGQSK